MERVTALLKEMTLYEKAKLLSGGDFWNTDGIERLGVSSVCLTDGPHGLRKTTGGAHAISSEHVKSTCFPAASATACSFDRELLYAMGCAMGRECRGEEVAVLLGPGVNIKRNPLCGRNFEYFSEDPYVSGKLAAAMIGGIESMEVGTSLKHYAVNNQEKCRMVGSSVIDERTLRELYLKPFEIVVKEGRPSTIMGSYNMVNGTYACEHPHLLHDILRKEWGYDGVVVTDWGAMNDPVAAVLAGCDLEMPGDGAENTELLLKAVEEGRLSEAAVTEAARRVLTLIMRGMENTVLPYDKEEHHIFAAKVATESAVLLKNTGVLPLHLSQKVAILGGFAKEPRYQGAGSSQIHPTALTSLCEALTVSGIPFSYADGYDAASRETAVKLAKEAEVAVVSIGLPPSDESEGYDRIHLKLPESHLALVEAVVETGTPVVVVLSCGGTVELPFRDKVAAILLMHLGGQNVGSAIKELLYGEKNPCGKLAETWGISLADYASTAYFGGRNPQYREGLYVGYRWFDTAEKEVAYPFGFGLSYTTFAYRDLTVTRGENAMTVTVTVENTGGVSGKEIVQLYVAPPKDSALYRPSHELKDFQKVLLSPGESKEVIMEIPLEQLRVYHDGAWRLEAGEYTVEIGASSRDIRLQHTVFLEGEQLCSSLTQEAPCYDHPAGILAVSDRAFAALLGHPIPKETPLRPYHRNSALIDLRQTPLGKFLFWIFEKKPEWFMGTAGAGGADIHTATDFRRMVEGMVYEMPLRSIPSMGLGALSHRQVDGIVELFNGNVLKGLRLLLFGKRKKK